MIFKISSFLTLALTLSFLDAVTATLMPRKKTEDPWFKTGVARIFDVPYDGYKDACGIVLRNDTPTVLLPTSQFYLKTRGEESCTRNIVNLTFDGVIGAHTTSVGGECKSCTGDDIQITQGSVKDGFVLKRDRDRDLVSDVSSSWQWHVTWNFL